MGQTINDDRETIEEGRKNRLPEEEVQAPLAERSVRKLFEKLEEENFGATVVSLFRQGDADRANWLKRQESYLDQYDEMLDPIIQAPADWASDLHLPVALTIGKTFHARFFSAVMGQNPICNVKSRQAANEERTVLIQDLMQYTLLNWANDYTGIEAEIDTFVWNWTMRGVGILKVGWDSRQSRIIDVVKKPRKVVQYVIDQDGNEVPVEVIKYDEVEEAVVVEDCNAPRVKRIPPEDVVIIGGKGDIDAADAVIEICRMTASDLNTLVDQGVFDEDAVNEVIKSGDNSITSQPSAGIKLMQTEKSGESMLDKPHDLDRYEILEAYIKKDVDGSGINTDIVVWVHSQSGRLLRATYLHRINRKTKKRPYAKGDFYIREGQTYGIGLIELTYSICNEIDALNNMAIDFGILSTMPFGYFRQGSSLSNIAIPIQPGTLIPTDDPSSIMFPNLGARHSFSMQHIAFLYGVLEKLVGLSDLNYGVIGGQGATRTASGVQALIQESNVNLDIFLRRLNRPIKKMMQYVFATLQERMPENMEFRVFGDNGQSFFRQVKSRTEIAGSFDFDMEPNSANSNPQIRLQTAQQIMAITGNPLDLQLGIITPVQRFEALKNYLIALGMKDYGRFIQKPQQGERVFTPAEVVNRIFAGIDVPILPTEDLVGFVKLATEFLEDDVTMGQVDPNQAMALESKRQQAVQMLQSLKQQQAQQANAQQMQRNQSMSSEQTLQPGGAQPAPAAPTEGQPA